MIEPRLASELRINALRKYMSQNGEFVTILHKGDAISGPYYALWLSGG